MIIYSSTTKDGNMSILAPKNRKKFFSKIGITESQIVNMHLVHGNNVVRVFEKDAGKLIEGTDGIITNSKKIFLGVLVADCLPIAIFDPITDSFGLVHAGWRGLENGIIDKAINLMKKEFGTESKNLTIYIGAHICQKHYEIKSDVAKSLPFKGRTFKDGRTFLDLALTAKDQLIELGIKNQNISIDKKCTYESPDLFSYRRGDKIDRNLYIFGSP